MGAGASNARPRPPPEPTVAELAALDSPYQKEGGERCFYCMPNEEDLKKRSTVIALEVGMLGFRLMRPRTEDCLFAYPWGQIHSWAHTDNRFSFRYFDDGKKAVVQYTLFLRDLAPLLEHIQTLIDAILAERKSQAIPVELFAELLREVQNGPRSSLTPVDLLQQRQYCDKYYFWAEQGRQLVDALPSSFDKIEVAVLLHGRLIDQNRFSYMLEGLESQADRDNVWHRITALKKFSTKLHQPPAGQRSSKSLSGAASSGGGAPPGASSPRTAAPSSAGGAASPKAPPPASASAGGAGSRPTSAKPTVRPVSASTGGSAAPSPRSPAAAPPPS
ncbi:hypothetical protein HYH03_007334 [Edaphochlamys debaryana]|uniref:Uncharacterized protein n=1 Tax=Edaphochlamys debaryana TaxID=47281 RepID=A0A835Y268_9CHLO|nr:hypothetical protein HYH03_007334 [Edaphochlamys debaryana]|eukprot:KAG2494568.1 hypothetical protein HYH03_007334 [Edaphochlamys debaryana]